MNLINGSCYYCLKSSTPDELLGIDRLDSNKGYTLDNCRSCCSDCNYSKNTLPAKVFIGKIAQILKNIDGRDDLSHLYNDIKFTSFKGGSYNTYKYNAKIRGLIFDINEEFFDNITSSVCYLCGENPINGNCGIDRYDNELGYTESNCRPCCHTCNFMKWCSSFESFIDRCRMIISNILTNDVFLPDVWEQYEHIKNFDHKVVKLTKKELKLITTDCRNMTDDWYNLEKRINSNKASTSDITNWKKFQTLINDSIAYALEEKKRIIEEID